MALDPITGTLNFGMKLMDKFFPDKNEAAKAKLRLVEMEQNGELEELKGAIQIITAEAQSDHWLAANWRPLLMCLFGVIIANNYILYPYLSLLFEAAPKLDIPPDMWQLLKIGVGGYVVGRSGEKMINLYKK